jgi:hypothetical protein
MVFSPGIGVGFSLCSQACLQRGSFDGWAAWDRFGDDVAPLSSWFQIPPDGRDRDGERFRYFCLQCSLIGRSQHTLPQIL